MDAAIVAEPAGERIAKARALRARLAAFDLHIPALAFVLAGTFLLRVWGIKQGLPYSYNVDEATHFVPRAIAFSAHDLNPHYFLNPPGYTYLLYVVFELWFGSADAVARVYASDPTSVFVVARVVAAVLGTASVWLLYFAGARMFGRTVGLLAAAVMAVAFLPVFYSHLALNDVPALAPVALSLYGTAGVIRFGRRRDYVIAGVGVGLAAATKYTGGIVVVCLLVAALQDAFSGRALHSVRRLIGAGLLAVLAFVVANPYALLHFSEFWSGVQQQASLAAGADPVKLGSHGNGVAYYLWTLTWGFGWVPALGALGGALLLLARRRIGMALVLIPAPIAFTIFMGGQQRFFGRWLMPIFPILALLAAYGTVELIRRLAGPAAGRWRLAVVGGLAAAVLLGQSVAAAVHDDAVLSRPDTRNLLRAWMVDHVPAASKVVLEPLVSDNWVLDVGRSLPWTSTGARWLRWPTWLTELDPSGQLLPDGERRYVVVDEYERTLYPGLLDQYVASGYCWVVIGSLQAGRAFSQPSAVPSAIAYYNSLALRAREVFHVSPFASGAQPIPFGFDWSIDYYPRQFRRPGPELTVYRLGGGKCAGSGSTTGSAASR
ncbi:MAG TPA: glycosyltransferase family 39 protein [Solirubrobacteraceae bacterium]|nr:glycosyltransferase family 39 protein [Solirubrobacteraceae bacterium]